MRLVRICALNFWDPTVPNWDCRSNPPNRKIKFPWLGWSDYGSTITRVGLSYVPLRRIHDYRPLMNFHSSITYILKGIGAISIPYPVQAVMRDFKILCTSPEHGWSEWFIRQCLCFCLVILVDMLRLCQGVSQAARDTDEIVFFWIALFLDELNLPLP
jgi:hypothetical protein